MGDTTRHGEFRTIQEIVLQARERLSAPIWDYVTYGAESETTVRRNRHALDSWAFKPRILGDMSEIDPASALFGERLRIPALLAPIGSIARFDPQGALAAARGAQTFGTMQFVASHAIGEIPDTDENRTLPLIYALHPHGDRSELDAQIDLIGSRGVRAISVATQSTFYSRRERDIHNDLLGKGQLARGYAPLVAKQHPDREGAIEKPLQKARLSWDMLAHIKERSRLPLILKGVQTSEDAEMAVRSGVDILYVSNNGGRAMDHVRGSLEVLPEVVAAAGGRAEVIVDGGVARGSDILKALALGAKAVCLGRLQAWALAANGVEGLVRMLELLEEEMIINMGLMGVKSVADLETSRIAAVTPCTEPHPLSAFPIVMEKIRSA